MHLSNNLSQIWSQEDVFELIGRLKKAEYLWAKFAVQDASIESMPTMSGNVCLRDYIWLLFFVSLVSFSLSLSSTQWHMYFLVCIMINNNNNNNSTFNRTALLRQCLIRLMYLFAFPRGKGACQLKRTENSSRMEKVFFLFLKILFQLIQSTRTFVGKYVRHHAKNFVIFPRRFFPRWNFFIYTLYFIFYLYFLRFAG